jgi:hypothetical protein
MDERCEHGVPNGKDNPNLPCSRCEREAATGEDASPTLERVPAVGAGAR